MGRSNGPKGKVMCWLLLLLLLMLLFLLLPASSVPILSFD